MLRAELCNLPVRNAAGASSARDMAVRARAASRKLQVLSTEERVAMLNRVADALVANQQVSTLTTHHQTVNHLLQLLTAK